MNIARTVTQLLIGALLTCPALAPAEDTDLFIGNPEELTAIPNVLILLDNTANWNTPFEAEKTALVNVLDSLSGDFNVGLMMFTETGSGNTGNDGAYIRYAVRRMCDTPDCDHNYKTALTGMVGALHKLNDKSNGGKLGKTMYEAYLYFNGGTAYAGDTKKKRDYAGNTVDNPLAAGLPGNALISAGSHSYVTPLGIDDLCANNYIIYISNGPAQDNTSDTTTATTQLNAVGGNTSSITLSPNGSQSNVGDEWARFLATHDLRPVESMPGNQFVFTYTLDISPGTTGQGPGWTALLKSMAKQGSGKYYEVDDLATLQDDLTDIFNQIQAANSVFASSTLPVSANVRGAYLNQVYMGVFRPDQFGKPHWLGNMKQYKIAKDSSTENVYLADTLGVAVENSSSGFIVPGAISYWTSSSTFWDYKPSGIPLSGSDSPDGAIVEKGGAAQRLRTTTSSGTSFTFVPGNRHLYTCTGSCASNSLLSATPFNTSNVSQAALGAANATEQTNIINWMLGYDNMDEDGDGVLTDVRPSIHGDVVHSRPAAVNYGGSVGVVLYYGTNDGVFRAVKGGQAASDGVEKWGFVPSEFFGKLKRQRDNSPDIDFYPEPEPRTNPKPYFADGPVGVYRYDANNDGAITGSDKVYIYISLRRGGRTLYALDVTNPDTPRFLWKKNNTDYPELGQTWPEPKVAAIKAHTNPVLIIGAGYDEVANAAITAATASMGRGVFVLDATDGSKVWMAGQGADADVTPSGMNYSIAADVAVLDRDGDGKADRLYAPDVAGNIWRFDIGDSNTSNWTVNKFAEVGGGRRFLFPVDVVYAYPARNYDAVLIGSGDREHPFDTTITNRFYMFKDLDISNLTASDPARSPIRESDLYDATANLVQVGSADEKTAAMQDLDAAKGWYVTLGAGEKVVGGSLTLFGTTYFGTHRPTALEAGTCSNLGEARGYGLSFSDGGATIDYNQDNALTTIDRYHVFTGGGFLPSPIYGYTDTNNDGVADTPVVCQGEHCEGPEANPLGERFRTYWYQEIDR